VAEASAASAVFASWDLFDFAALALRASSLADRRATCASLLRKRKRKKEKSIKDTHTR